MRINKTRRINLRLTEAEYTELSSRVRNSTSRRLSIYLRNIIFDKPITVFTRDQSLDEFMEEMIRLRSELIAQGNNFNQVVRKINSSPNAQVLSFWLPVAKDLQQQLLEKTKFIQERINKFSEKWLPS